MKSLKGPTLPLSFVIIILNTSVALASIEVAIYDPTPWAYWVASGPFSGTVHISAKVTSTFTVSGVTAQVDGRSIPLTYSATAICGHLLGSCSGGWAGTMDLSGLSEGTKNLTVSALDGYGNSGSATAQFVIDGKPTVNVTSPANSVVVTYPGDVRLAATCNDVMGNCVGMNAIASSNNTVLASGTTSIDQTVSLAAYNGTAFNIRFDGQDSAGQTTSVSKGVSIELSRRLARLLDVTGTILDFGADGRLLYLDTANDTSTLKIKNTLNNTTIDVYGSATRGFLTPGGAMFVVGNTLYEWKNGVLSGIAGNINGGRLVVRGNYAVWHNGTSLMQKNLASGEVTTISNNSSIWYWDVDANGAIVFLTSIYSMYYYSGGAMTDMKLSARSPLIDGGVAVYQKVFSTGTGSVVLDSAIYMYSPASGEVALTPRVLYNSNPGYTPQYMVSNGWIAYSQLAADGTSQIWLRSPDGSARQVTFFGTSSNLVSLAPTGELIISNGVVGKLYAYRLSSGLTELSTTLPKPFYRGSAWYATIDSSIFTLDTSPVSVHPVITDFVIPALTTSPTIQIQHLGASDSTYVTGYMITESSTAPLPGNSGWKAVPPSSYTLTTIPQGVPVTTKLYVWILDSAGFVSNSMSSSVLVSLPDTTLPVITSFSIPRNSFELSVPVTFTATDNIGVVDWCLTETNSSSSCSWYQAPPANYTFGGLGYNKSLYAFVRDTAGNVSSPASAATSITRSYSITPAAGFGGIILPNGVQKIGASPASTFTFTVTPVPGYHIASVTGCGGTLSGRNYTTGPIAANCFVTARFEKSDAMFSEKAYLAANTDIAEAIRKGLYGITSGWDHYLRGGKNEGRKLQPVAFSQFNEDAYLAANPDIIPLVKSGQVASAWHHYICGGIGEGRNLQPFGYATFNEAAYLAANLDVAEALQKGLYGISSGWDHYVKSGKAEGRALQPQGYGDFNEAAYLAANPDVAAAVKAGQLLCGWQHYNSSGKLEERPLQPAGYGIFNEKAYLAANADIANALRNGLYGISSGWDHYSRSGRDEKRRIEPISYSSFNDEAYLNANPDVAAAIKTGQIANGWQHYTCGGIIEGRKLEPPGYGVFSEITYHAANPDVAAAIKAGQVSNGWQHYTNSGKVEGRRLTPAGYGGFNEEAYLFANPDVSQAIKTGQIDSGWQHYQSSGKSEGRQLYPVGYIIFDEARYLAANTNVAIAVKAGQFNSGWEHYMT